MKLAVLMPAWNTALWVGEAVRSILSQTFKNFRLLVADDGSTDETWLVIQKAARADSRARCFRLPHRGAARTRNFLLREAAACEADVVAWQDSDDLSHPYRLERQMAEWARRPVDVLGCLMAVIEETGELKIAAGQLDTGEPVAFAVISEMPIGPVTVREKFLRDAAPVTFATTFMRLSALRKLNGALNVFSPDVSFEDVHLMGRLMATHAVIDNLPARQPLYFVRERSGRLSSVHAARLSAEVKRAVAAGQG